MDERGFRTNEFHEFFQPYAAICLFQGTWKKGNFTVPSLCNGDVLEKREKPWPLLGTSEPLAGLMGRGQARSKEVWGLFLLAAVSHVSHQFQGCKVGIKSQRRSLTSERHLPPLLNRDCNLCLVGKDN